MDSLWPGPGPVGVLAHISTSRHSWSARTCIVSRLTSKPNNWRRLAILSASDISLEEKEKGGVSQELVLGGAAFRNKNKK